jgi:hypothetical protein
MPERARPGCDATPRRWSTFCTDFHLPPRGHPVDSARRDHGAFDPELRFLPPTIIVMPAA